MKQIGIRLFLLACLLPVSILLEKPAPNEAALQENGFFSSVLKGTREANVPSLGPQLTLPDRFDLRTGPEKITEISIEPGSAKPKNNAPGKVQISQPKDTAKNRVLKLVKSRGIAREKDSPVS